MQIIHSEIFNGKLSLIKSCLYLKLVLIMMHNSHDIKNVLESKYLIKNSVLYKQGEKGQDTSVFILPGCIVQLHIQLLRER